MPLGSCMGIPVRLHITFILLLAVQTLAMIPAGTWWILLAFLVMGPLLLATVFAHEMGHCLAARSVGGKAEGILLWPLGGLAYIHHNASPKHDMWVAFAGPLTHVPMTGFWLGMNVVANKMLYDTATVSLSMPYILDSRGLGVAFTSYAIIINVSMCAFNLLMPAYPLDGGRILVDALLWCGLVPVAAAKVTLAVAVPLSLAIIIVGGVKIQVTTILIGVFILYANYQLFDCLRKGQLDQHPLFSFTASQQATAAAAGVEAGYPGQYPQYAPGPPAGGHQARSPVF